MKLKPFLLGFILFLFPFLVSAGLPSIIRYGVSKSGPVTSYRFVSSGANSANTAGSAAGAAKGGYPSTVVRDVGSFGVDGADPTIIAAVKVAEGVSWASMAGAVVPFLRFVGPLGIAATAAAEILKWLKDAGIEPEKDSNGNPVYTQPFKQASQFTRCERSGDFVDYSMQYNVSPQTMFQYKLNQPFGTATLSQGFTAINTITLNGTPIDSQFRASFSYQSSTYYAYITCISPTSAGGPISDTQAADKLASHPPTSTDGQKVLDDFISPNTGYSIPDDAIPLPDGPSFVMPGGTSSTAPGQYQNPDGSSTTFNPDGTAQTIVHGPSSTTHNPDGSSQTVSQDYVLDFPGNEYMNVSQRTTTTYTDPNGNSSTSTTNTSPTPSTTSPNQNSSDFPTDCKLFPNSLGCQDKLDPETSHVLPKETINVTQAPYQDVQGQCPNDRIVYFMGRPIPISWKFPCDFAVMLRPIIIAIALFMGGLIIFRGAKNAA